MTPLVCLGQAGIEYTEDGVLGARVGVAYDDRHPPLILPLDLESMDTLSRAIERAHKRWERFSDKLRMLGVREIPRAQERKWWDK